MENKDKKIDALPDSFGSEEEAGEFWDKHSAVDYVEFLEPANHSIKIENRIYEVRIAEDVFQKLQLEAESSQQSVPTVVDQILRKQLTSV